MRKERHLGKLNIIISGVILFLALVIFFIVGAVNNSKKRTFTGIVNEEGNDFDILLEISKSWTIGEEYGDDAYGEQFDFKIDDNKKYELRHWSLTIDFDSEKFDLLKIDSSWNVTTKELGKKIIISVDNPEITLINISPSEGNTFGYIFHLRNQIFVSDSDNFTYTLTGTAYRPFVSYPAFWVLAVLLFVYIAVVVSFTIISIREQHFIKFKEQSYSIISQSMNTFASLIDTKDPYTKDHSARVSYYSVKIARKLGMDDEYVRNIAYIALMHDCGKLVIEDDILTKPAKLTAEEFKIMKEHTTYGGNALKNLTAIKDMQDGAMYHHERYDGSGYPKGLKGEEIPLCARIIGVADALDAMNSDRCYRKRLSREKILSELENCSGKQFDPKIAKIVIDMINNNEIEIEK